LLKTEEETIVCRLSVAHAVRLRIRPAVEGDGRAGSRAAVLQLEFYVVKPTSSPDERFHRVITESLEAWWREQSRQSGRAMVTVIGDDPSARVHELRDLAWCRRGLTNRVVEDGHPRPHRA
jgi:hypothetical protein